MDKNKPGFWNSKTEFFFEGKSLQGCFTFCLLDIQKLGFGISPTSELTQNRDFEYKD